MSSILLSINCFSGGPASLMQVPGKMGDIMSQPGSLPGDFRGQLGSVPACFGRPQMPRPFGGPGKTIKSV